MMARWGFKNISVLVGTGKVFSSGYVLFKGGLIEEVGSMEACPDAEGLLDEPGCCITPGFIDCHTHITLNYGADPARDLQNFQQRLVEIGLQAAANVSRTLESGVTCIRDLGGIDHIDIKVRNAINTGVIKGPRTLCAGRFVCATGGHGWQIGRQADGPDEISKAVREQIREGADVIKLMASGGIVSEQTKATQESLTPGELSAATRMAKSYGRRTAAHAHATASIKNAIEAGVDSIEHGIFLDEPAIELMLKRDVFLVPTLSAPHHIIQSGRQAGMPEFLVCKTEEIYERHRESFRKAFNAGVRIAMGSDAGSPLNHHGSNLLELELMVSSGMDSASALKAATVNAASLLGLSDSIGSLEKGKAADAVVYAGDFLSILQNTRRLPVLKCVVKGGELVTSKSNKRNGSN